MTLGTICFPSPFLPGAIPLLCFLVAVNQASLLHQALLPCFCFGTNQPCTGSSETVSQIQPPLLEVVGASYYVSVRGELTNTVETVRVMSLPFWSPPSKRGNGQKQVNRHNITMPWTGICVRRDKNLGVGREQRVERGLFGQHGQRLADC